MGKANWATWQAEEVGEDVGPTQLQNVKNNHKKKEFWVYLKLNKGRKLKFQKRYKWEKGQKGQIEKKGVNGLWNKQCNDLLRWFFRGRKINLTSWKILERQFRENLEHWGGRSDRLERAKVDVLAAHLSSTEMRRARTCQVATNMRIIFFVRCFIKFDRFKVQRFICVPTYGVLGKKQGKIMGNKWGIKGEERGK